MAKSKINSIRLNQIIDSNKIDNETFAIVYLQKELNRIKLAKKYFGYCKHLDINADYYINNSAFLYNINCRIQFAEKLIKSDSLRGIKILKKGMITAVGK